MRATLASAAFVALAAANPMPSGSPSTSAPAGCKADYPGTFNIELVNVTTGASKRSMEKRDLLTIKLAGGVLTDALGRIGSIVSNGQFQFDGPPPQAGAEYTSGWSVCPNNTLTLGAQTVFYECLTSNYYNIYDKSIGGQCGPVFIQVINGGSGAASQISDGQPQATPVSQISDGQPQAPTGKPVSQISDGQPQAPTGKPVSQISDGQPQAPTGNPVSQISDGQPQAPTGKPVSQISDGQPQAPASPTGKPVSQISDGQPQAPATTPTRSPLPAVNATVATTKPASATSTTPAASTGGAVANAVGAFGVFAGAVAFALL